MGVQTKRYLREGEVEVEFGISKATLRTLRCRGGGPPFVKMGHAVYYCAERLEQWLADREQTLTTKR